MTSFSYELERFLCDYGRSIPQNKIRLHAHFKSFEKAISAFDLATQRKPLLYYSEWFKCAYVIRLDKVRDNVRVFKTKSQEEEEYEFEPSIGEPNPKSFFVKDSTAYFPEGSNFFFVKDAEVLAKKAIGGQLIIRVSSKSCNKEFEQYQSYWERLISCK